MVMRSLVLVAFLALANANASAQAECGQKGGQSSESYKNAVQRLQALPAVMDWQDQVTESGSTAKFLPPADWQIEMDGRCYWSIGLYSDEGTHFHLWRNYLVSADGVVLEEVDDDEPLAMN